MVLGPKSKSKIFNCFETIYLQAWCWHCLYWKKLPIAFWSALSLTNYLNFTKWLELQHSIQQSTINNQTRFDENSFARPTPSFIGRDNNSRSSSVYILWLDHFAGIQFKHGVIGSYYSLIQLRLGVCQCNGWSDLCAYKFSIKQNFCILK